MQPDDDNTRTHVALTSGTMVSHYRIIEKIGAGGMGEVYLAEDTKLDRKVALKFLPPHLCQDADCRARFTREAQAAAKLNHPNIVIIHEVGEISGRPFFAMEHVEGKTLRDLGKEKEITLSRIIEFAIQVCEGLSKAHAAGIVHRDIKPSNILIDEDGRAKIVDFGLASVHGREHLTKTGSTLGTAGYMSPEQARGEEVDARSDLFSFGVVLYELITGRSPFKAESEIATVKNVLEAIPEPLARYKSGVPDDLQRILSKALTKDKNLRYQHAEDICVDLLREKETLSQPDRLALIESQTKKAWLIPAVGFTLLILVLIGGIYFAVVDRIKIAHVAKQKQVTFVGDAVQCTLSPDGTSIAYGEVRNDKARVLIQNLQGGEPLQVTDCENVRFLHWSPSGTELLMGIVAGTGRTRFMIVPQLGGSAREYIGGKVLGRTGFESAAWSPDGASFVAHSGFSGRPFCFVDKKSGDISLVNAKTPEGWVEEITWSPRGDRLLFRVDASLGASYWTIKTDGTELSALPCGEGFAPCWSSTGDAVYYLTTKQESASLMKQKIDPTKGACRGEPQELLSGLQTAGPISISAHGDKLIYPRSDYFSNLWLVIIGVSGEPDSIAQLTFGTARVNDPAISPDGKMLAFAVAEFGEQHICTMPLTGGARKRLTFTAPVNFGPSWSADGQQIAFICWYKDAYRVAIMNADGSGVRYFDNTVVTSVPGVGACTWGAGQSILYQREGNRNFSVLNVETGKEHPLISNDTVGWLFRPLLSPDGGTLAVYWNRSLGDQGTPAGRGIWTMAPDGGDQRMILHRDSIYAPLGWSSDGNSLYVYSSEMSANPDIFILPATGGAAKKVTEIPLRDVTSLRMSPDCKRFICCVGDRRSDLWLVEDFDPDVK